MTEYQEGRTYLWIYEGHGLAFEARVVTGNMQEGCNGVLEGDDGETYGRVTLLTERTYRFATRWIEGRGEWLDRLEFAASVIREYEETLMAMERAR